MPSAAGGRAVAWRAAESGTVAGEVRAVTAQSGHAVPLPRPRPAWRRRSRPAGGRGSTTCTCQAASRPRQATGSATSPAFKWRGIAPHLPTDLRGWRALDIGCNAGFYSFALADRGADVLGIDSDEHYLAQARWAAEVTGRRCGSRTGRSTEVAALGSFDLVLFFMGVF